MGCGKELARHGRSGCRLHAPPDPHYGLPVVVCPGCGLACVRRPGGGTARWYTFLRAFAAARRLVFGGWLLVATLALGTMMCGGVAVGLEGAISDRPFTALFKLDAQVRQELGRWWAYQGLWIVPVWTGAWATVGLVAGAFFPHWKARWWVPGMAAFIVAAILVPTSLIALREWLRSGTPPVEAFRADGPGTNAALSLLLSLAAGVVLSGAVMPFAQAAGRKLATTKGLRSKRLTRTRRKRSRQT